MTIKECLTLNLKSAHQAFASLKTQNWAELPQSIQADPYLHVPYFQKTHQTDMLLQPHLQVEATSSAAACSDADSLDVDMGGSCPSLVQPAQAFSAPPSSGGPSSVQPHAAAAQRAQHATLQDACSHLSGLSMASGQSHTVPQVTSDEPDCVRPQCSLRATSRPFI